MKNLQELIDGLNEIGKGRTTVLSFYSPTFVELAIHDVPSYDEATRILRDFGIGEREKQPLGTEQTYVCGQLNEHVKIGVYCMGLPPTCHLERYKERVPKTQVVDSGEFIEVERTRVVCGKEVVS